MPPGMVSRQGLVRLLRDAATRPVTVVSAGPGAGKTLTVAAWIAAGTGGGAAAWVSLDESDNDLRSFWSNVINALLASGAVPPDHSLRDISPAGEFGPSELRDVLARVAELPAPVVLVLDDFHEITSEAVLESFGGLVDRVPASLALMLLSRIVPPLRLHRLRVRGDLTEIGAADLAFTQSEAAELFDRSGLNLHPDQVAVLRERTEGWPAGLRLAAMSLDPDDPDSGITRFSGSERSVAEYLVGEVTQRLSAADREFMLRTSVVERVSGPLADELTDRTDSQAVLERFVRANAFVVVLGGRDQWFSYHPLLRELLRHRLALEQSQYAAALHRRAAGWLFANGEPVEAIRHAILGADLDSAGRILLSVTAKILGPEAPQLAAALEPLAATATAKPSLTALLASAMVNFHRHQFTAMLRDALDARYFLEESVEDLRRPGEVFILLLEMVAAREQGDSAQVAAKANDALTAIATAPPLPAGRAFRTIATINLAGAQVWAGGPDTLGDTLRDAAREALELGMLLPQLNALSHLALHSALSGRYQDASRGAAEAIRIIERRAWGSEPQALAAFLGQGLVDLAGHRLDAADALLQRGLAATGGQTDRALRAALAIAAAQSAVSLGDAAAALTADMLVASALARTPQAAAMLVRWGAVAGAEALLLAGRPTDALRRIASVQNGDDVASQSLVALLARSRFELGELQEADELLEPLLRSTRWFPEPKITALVLHALVADRQRRETVAQVAISVALDLAAPEHIRRPFVLLGARLIEPLIRYRHTGGRHDGFAADLVRLLEQRAGSTGHDTTDPIEGLTEREMIVLRYLPTMLKASEIADDLYVSVNTVKSHLQSMYQKLGVSNRRGAVERAKSAGLL
jgi:LuxR family maltose regulon positive regulatory protein